MNKNNKWNIVVKTSLFVGMATFVSSLLLSLYWHRDGYDNLELLLLSVTSAIIFLFFIIVGNYKILKSHRIRMHHRGEPNLKRRYALPSILVLSFIVYMILDTIIFMIDPSISQDYWSFVVNLEGGDNSSISTTLFPIALLNLFQNISLGMIGGLVSMMLVKRHAI